MKGELVFGLKRNAGSRRTQSKALRASRWLAIAGILALAGGCVRTSPESSDTAGINDRPQNHDRFLAIIKLSEPALLTVSSRSAAGMLEVPAAALAAVEAEQTARIAELAALSADIRVLQRYRFSLNGLAIVAPKSVESQIRRLSGLAMIEADGQFARPESVEAASGSAAESSTLAIRNSVAFIGAEKVRAELTITNADGTTAPVDGRGVHVGVIDTGIDYTHAMFGGAGTVEAFNAINPAVAPESGFPSAKVVGGIDLVGTTYNAASARFDDLIPQPDRNPMDEGGHGSHVAGTIAGIGNGETSYTGVAPEALLHAIKVFGKDGSTNTSIVLAALEYAVDPNQDLNPMDALDVLNLSLGSSYGTPAILYSEAVANLGRGGIVTVASAGNSGNSDYIVGSPSTAPEAISVAASVDDMDHNWKFPAVRFAIPSNSSLIAEAIEGTITRSIADAGDVQGVLVPIGLAAEDLPDAQRAAVAGKVALIDRGVVPFADKIRRAAGAGAIGVVVANNRDGEPISMGGDGQFDIPGIMITKALGDQIKTEIAAGGEASIQFKTDVTVEKPQLIDTITGFSSKGPRSVDGLLKPEIAAPGQNIISAKSGGGAEVVRMSGTSMAAPHMAGVMALLRQYRRDLTGAQLKSLALASAKPIKDATSVRYPVTRQGSGRVDAFAAAKAQVVFSPAALSLGQTSVERVKSLRASVAVQSLSTAAQSLAVMIVAGEGVRVETADRVELAAGATTTLDLLVTIDAPAGDAPQAEREGWVVLKTDDGVEVARVPFLAVATRVTRLAASRLEVSASSPADAPGAAASVQIRNPGTTSGEAMVFNLLGKDERNVAAIAEPLRTGHICDLESVGWRVVSRDVNGETKAFLQIAAKLWQPVTTWNLCEISVQFDANGDSVAEQELLATDASNYIQTAPAGTFQSLLMDAARMREIRRNYENTWTTGATANYAEALVDATDVRLPRQGSLAVVSADLGMLAKTATGELRMKVGVLANSGAPEGDDFFAFRQTEWVKVSAAGVDSGWNGMPESSTVAAGETLSLPLVHGGASLPLVVYMPANAPSFSDVRGDLQSRILRPVYRP